MKKTILSLLLVCFAWLTIQAQNEPVNPFEEFGYTPKIATLSKGKYVEFYDQDSIVQISHALFNVNTMKLVGFVQYDTTYSEATLEPEVISRFLSPDPLTSEFPSWSPYNYAADNPIRYIDKDGLAPWIPEVGSDGSAVYRAEKGDNVKTFVQQFNISRMNADKLFARNRYRREGDTRSSSKSNLNAGDLITGGGYLGFNLKKTDGGFLKSDFFSSKTQQQAINHLQFTFEYTEAQGKFSFDINKAFNYDPAEIAGFTGGMGITLKGALNGNPVSVDVALYNGFGGTNPVSTSPSSHGGDSKTDRLNFSDPRGNLGKISITSPVQKSPTNTINTDIKD